MLVKTGPDRLDADLLASIKHGPVVVPLDCNEKGFAS
jgi:hypothetical protein